MQLAQHEADPQEEMTERFNDVCHRVNTSLSTVILCIDFLAERSDALGNGAVRDARAAVRSICAVMATLRDTLEPEASAPMTSAVFRKTDPRRSEGERPSEPSRHL